MLSNRFSRWFRRTPRPTRTFRPGLVQLEDRTVPTVSTAATHLQVFMAPSVQSGLPTDVIVQAITSNNQAASSYAGTVKFALGTPDPGASLPATYTFTSADHGRHDFKITLVATGPQQVIVTDQATPAVKGSISTMVLAPPTASSVLFLGPKQTVTGAQTPITVQIEDQYHHVVPGFAGTVSFTSNDGAATVSSTNGGTQGSLQGFTYTYTAADHGWHTFYFNFGTGAAGGTTTTLMVTGPGVPLFGASTSLTVYPPTAVTHFGLVATQATYTNHAVPVVLEALNAANQPVSGFTGTVKFSSSDSAAKITASTTGALVALSSFSYTFTSGDAGKHTFYVSYATAGVRTLTAADAFDNLSATANVLVVAPPPPPRPGLHR
jgi:hypothetical protein